jgi:hypothetical protein
MLFGGAGRTVHHASINAMLARNNTSTIIVRKTRPDSHTSDLPFFRAPAPLMARFASAGAAHQRSEPPN